MALVDPGCAQEFKASRRLPLVGRTFSALVILGLIVVSWRFSQQGIFAHPETLVQAVGSHPVSGGVLFLLIYAVTIVTGIPTLPLNLAAGWLWGPLLGGALSAVGASSGATLAFGAARTIFGQPLRTRFGNKFLAWAQDEFDRKGWRFIAFIRLNPVFPTGPLNYLFGLTSIRARTYIWSTAISLLPASVIVAWIGSEIGRVRSGAGVGQIMHVAFGISAAVSVMVAIRYLARYLNHAKLGRRS